MATILEINESRKYMGESITTLSFSDFGDNGFNAFNKAKLIDVNERINYKEKNFSEEDKEKIIKKLYLNDNQSPTRYAAIFFYQQPVSFVPGSYVTITMYDEKNEIILRSNVGTSFEINKKNIPQGLPIISSIENTIGILYEFFLGKQFLIDGIARVEQKPIPQGVIREAVVNAHIHKDYSAQEPIRIEVYPNVIKIYNRCLLEDSIDADSIKKGLKLNRLNPRMCEAMGQTIYYEGEGSGVQRMNNILEAENLGKVDYELNGNTLCTILPNPSGISHPSASKLILPFEKLEKNEIIILKAAYKTPITRKLIEKTLKIEKTQAGKLLFNLVKKGLLKKNGSGPNTEYILIDLGKKAVEKE